MIMYMIILPCTTAVVIPGQKLEKQLRDVAYGTRQYRVRPAEEDEEEVR